MTIPPIETSIRYVTNAAGEKTDVLVPVEIWEQLMASLQNASGLDPADEQESNSQILADLQESIWQSNAGQTFPVSELWNDIET